MPEQLKLFEDKPKNHDPLFWRKYCINVPKSLCPYGICPYYKPKQYPGGDANAGYCLYELRQPKKVPDSMWEKNRKKARKLQRQFNSQEARGRWIPDLAECPRLADKKVVGEQ